MAEKRNIAGLIVGVGMLLVAVPIAASLFGVDITDPFKPTAYATITITPVCVPYLTCWFNEPDVNVVIDTIRPTSIILPRSLAIYPACNLPGGGGLVSFRIEIPKLNYYRTKPTMGPEQICDSPISETFAFNYVKGESYFYTVKILGKSGETLLQKTGSVSL